MTWWLWVALGLVLGAIELATPGGFFVIFFGVAAVVVGLAELAGLGLPLVGPVAGLPDPRPRRAAAVPPAAARAAAAGRRAVPVDSMVSEVAVPVAAIEPGQHGRAELRGTVWAAHNVAPTAVAAGQRCRVVAVNGLQLDIRPE